MHIIQPSSPDEMSIYYQIRFETLRKPWGQPEGSEKDETDADSIHALLYIDNTPAGVCRLHFNTADEAQIRYMGICNEFKGKGFGKLLMDYLENIAYTKGANKIILHAREKAMNFYLRQGYKTVEKSYLMWNEIQHYLMVKIL